MGLFYFCNLSVYSHCLNVKLNRYKKCQRPFILVICHISNRVSNGMEKMYFGGIKGENSIEICVLDVQYSNNGEKCKNKCQKDGESYNWCWKISGSWDYCTPLALGKK